MNFFKFPESARSVKIIHMLMRQDLHVKQIIVLKIKFLEFTVHAVIVQNSLILTRKLKLVFMSLVTLKLRFLVPMVNA